MDPSYLQSRILDFFKKLIPFHPLTNLEPRFNAVYSRNKLPHKIKYGVYVTNLDEYSDIGTHWIPF